MFYDKQECEYSLFWTILCLNITGTKQHEKNPSKHTLCVWSTNERFPRRSWLLQLTQCLCAV